MANIPKLQQNVRAQAVTQTVDRSGVLKEQQRGIADFGNFIQATIKQTTALYDSKVYASDSTKGQEELLGFMSETKNEQIKNDYFKQNKGNMAGYATFRAQKNMELMEKRLSDISHPKARKELEKAMSYQAQKSLLSDLGDENRIVQGLVQEKYSVKSQVLATSISNMKSPTNDDQYEIEVNRSLLDIDEGVNSGEISVEMGVKMRKQLLNNSAHGRARALVEGGNPLAALKSVKRNTFGSPEQQISTRNYVVSKHLDGKKKQFEAINARNRLKKAENEEQRLQIEEQAQAINNSEGTEREKMAAIGQLRNNFSQNMTPRQDRILTKMSAENGIKLLSRLKANIAAIPAGQTDSALYKRTTDDLLSLTIATNTDAKTKKSAAALLKSTRKKQKRDEIALWKDAEKGLKKRTRNRRMFDRKNKALRLKVEATAEAENMPVEGEVELYNLYLEGQGKMYLDIAGKKLRGAGDDRPFSMDGATAVKLFNEDSSRPGRFEAIMKAEMKRKKPGLNKKEIDWSYRGFKKKFDDFHDKFENFETKKKEIIEKYKRNS